MRARQVAGHQQDEREVQQELMVPQLQPKSRWEGVCVMGAQGSVHFRDRDDQIKLRNAWKKHGDKQIRGLARSGCGGCGAACGCANFPGTGSRGGLLCPIVWDWKLDTLLLVCASKGGTFVMESLSAPSHCACTGSH
eukprot:scaffold223543_cov12-Tisochrysis_lutea.AAC.1